MSAEPVRLPQTILRVANLSESLSFYRERIGFDEVFYCPDRAVGCVAGPGGVTLLLAAEGADLADWKGVFVSGPRAWVYLMRPDLATLARELTERGFEGLQVVETHPGYRHLQVCDPDGYVLTFWEPLPLSDEETVSIYRKAPERLRRVLDGLSEAELDTPWEPGKWTLRQIVLHILDADLGTFEAIRHALMLPGSEVQAMTWLPEDWMSGLRCHERPVEPSLALFAAERAWVLELVEHLPDALDRSVVWPSGYTAQVRDLLRQVGSHALHHIGQIEATRQRLGK